MRIDAPVALDSLSGVWRRTLLATETAQDSSSQVWWLQSSTLYVDLRLPDRSIDPSQRLEGSSGYLRTDGELFHRFHAISLNPWRGTLDSAALQYRDEGLKELVVRGARHVYLSQWSRVPDDSSVCWGADLVADEGSFATVVLVGGHLGWASSGPSGIRVFVAKRSPHGWSVLASSHPQDSGSSLCLDLVEDVLDVRFDLPDGATASQRWSVHYQEGAFPA